MKFSLTKNASSSSRPTLSGSIGHQIATDPFLDWLLILAIAFMAALILVGTDISVYLDSRARLEAPVTVSARTQTLPLDEAAMMKIIQSLEGRAESRSRVLHGFVAPRDPTLP
ncbi:MAG TPA: hypothetical protein VF438_02170 [Candidatus Paceibacterota bacterium]